jgi:hypothetical protein
MGIESIYFRPGISSQFKAVQSVLSLASTVGNSLVEKK